MEWGLDCDRLIRFVDPSDCVKLLSSAGLNEILKSEVLFFTQYSDDVHEQKQLKSSILKNAHLISDNIYIRHFDKMMHVIIDSTGNLIEILSCRINKIAMNLECLV